MCCDIAKRDAILKSSKISKGEHAYVLTKYILAISIQEINPIGPVSFFKID